MLIASSIADTRSLTFELSPGILYKFGLGAALESLLEDFEKKFDIRFEFEDDGNPRPMNDETRFLLFRAVRELLFNIVKHAKSRTAKVTVRRTGNHLRITVEDSGEGFDATMIPVAGDGKGFGIFSIRERLRYLGGRLEIESEPGNGSRFALVVPVETVS